ncbi:MAG TPA: pectinesterase family protein, partial [Terriglobia bacterium]|nr:pectinesterase family protein [Terriglobia bacterium]
PAPIVRYPADKSAGINPDTHLVLTFPSVPTLGKSGQIRIYDAADNKLVDTLDLSIPAGPAATGGRGGTAAPAAPPATMTPVPYDYVTGRRATNANTVPGTPSGIAVPTPATSQLSIIGGFTDAFHFYPVIIHDNTATIYPHNNLLVYDKTYSVQIDPGVLTLADGTFTGITGTGWTFSTKKAAPAADSARLVVSGDGTGDFNTVQGALDFIPDSTDTAARRITVFIRNGTYEEIVYFRNKSNVTLLGEDREKVLVTYANNEVFNPHPANVGTNEVPGTFPSRRAAFMGDNSRGIQLVNFSIRNPANGQAEGLLLMGAQNIVSNVNIAGSGDALQLNGSTYLQDCLLEGAGDSILGRGPEFFDHCELHSRGVYMWIRNTDANHGNVFVNSKFLTPGNGMTEIARAPTNNGKNYPYAEAVLINCIPGGISPIGWGAMGGDTANMHYWEFNSTNAGDGKPVDVSQRKAESRQLTMPKDAEIIANYSNPTYVLGWTPTMAPLILMSPSPTTVTAGQNVTLKVSVAAIPAPSFQWFRNGSAISGANGVALNLNNVRSSNAGSYTVTATNSSGRVTSVPATVTIR